MKYLSLILFLSAAAMAQDPPKQDAPKQMAQKIFELKHVEPGEVQMLLRALDANISPVNNLHMIAVRASKETIDVIEEALKRIDVPRPAKKNIEFTGYMILASSKTTDTTDAPELAPVIKQLRALFPYKGYRVVETMFLRSRDGDSGNASGYIVDSLNGNRHSYKFGFNTAALTADRQIRMNNVHLEVNTPSGILGFRTQLDIREGQKVVVGKSNVVGTEDALILVLNAKVIE